MQGKVLTLDMLLRRGNGPTLLNVVFFVLAMKRQQIIYPYNVLWPSLFGPRSSLGVSYPSVSPTHSWHIFKAGRLGILHEG